MAKKKWFKKAVEEKPPYTLGGWRKTQAAETRRKKALASRPKNWLLKKRYISAARALQALANVTEDSATEKKAIMDAKFFFKKAKGM